jgi:hypothetical protein
MKINRHWLVSLLLFAVLLFMSNLSLDPAEEVKRFHSDAERAQFQMMMMDTSLPTGYNYLFAGSGVCQKCHGFDTAGVASVDAFGNDVNVTDDWRATMMANSAKDPFWRAKVSHEVTIYPHLKTEIEDKCTACHAPMGHFDAKHLGAAHYGMADLIGDPLAEDGVSCLACHLQSKEGLGSFFSGELHYDTFKVAYGPYTSPLVSPMLTETGYKPQFSEHISDAGQCAGCHTLLTKTVDFQGNITGNKFVEQATYHEWLNSDYKDSVSCQRCHMPSLDKFPVFLVTGAQTEPRSPFFLHEFVGGNVTMLKLLKNNIEALGIKAGPSQFNEVIAKTEDLLKNKTLLLDLKLLDRNPDTAFFAVKLTNLAGHKFPSGYPSRRAFIEFLVKNGAGDTLFISGKTNDEFEVYGQNDDYEPHYQVISGEDQVQIYELVMGDVNGNVTTVLERADHAIKDNRLTPKGFSQSHYAYDTTIIAGGALDDENFNRDENGAEGSGSDLVYFHIPMNGNLEKLQVSAKVYYQSTPPKWNKEMFEHNTPEINLFREMFAATDRSPVLVREAAIEAPEIVSAAKSRQKECFVRLFPTPSTDGRIVIEATRKHDLQVYDLNGRLAATLRNQIGKYELHLTEKGVYLLKFTARNGMVRVEKVVVR